MKKQYIKNKFLRDLIAKNEVTFETLTLMGINTEDKLEKVLSTEIPFDDIKTLAYSLLRGVGKAFNEREFTFNRELDEEERTSISKSVLNKLAEMRTLSDQDTELYKKTLAFSYNSKVTKEQRIKALANILGYDIPKCPKGLLNKTRGNEVEAVILKYSSSLSEDEIEKMFLLPKGGLRYSEVVVLGYMREYLKIGTMQVRNYTKPDEEYFDSRIYKYLLDLQLKIKSLSEAEKGQLKSISYSISRLISKPYEDFDIYTSIYPTNGSEPKSKSEIMSEKFVSYGELSSIIEKVELAIEQCFPNFKIVYNEFFSDEAREKSEKSV